MRCLALFVLFTVSVCGANNLECQLFDESTKSLERYCGIFKGILPINCSKDPSIDASVVKQLKLNGCDSEIVLDAIKTYKNVRVLDISQSGYKSLEWLNLELESLMVLNASYNEISNISKLIQNAPYVNVIDLSHNKLTTINQASFGRLDSLLKIDFSHNLLEHINFDFFAASINLEFIDLSNNNFLGLPGFPQSSKLKTIHLEENTIKNFTCQRVPWESSVSVFLSWNYVELFNGHKYCEGKHLRIVRDADDEGIFSTAEGTYELHCNDQSFRNLRYFRAGRNSFMNVIDVINSLDRPLSTLDLSGNVIDKLDLNTFKRFINLHELSLSDTKLVHFDFGMVQSEKSLQSLDISYNNLKRLNNLALLRNFVELKKLNVAGNQLQGTSEITHYLNTGAEFLDLSNNNMGILYNFERLTKLKTLIVSNANLTFTEINPFEALAQLHVLDISHNNMSNVNFKTLTTTLIKLDQFNVAYCQVKNILEVIQYLGTSLKKLNLSGNRIYGLNSKTFETLSNLVYLNLSNANLMQFDFETVRNQKWLYTLDISNNGLETINLQSLPRHNYLRWLQLENNELTQLNNFVPSESPNVSLGMAKNQFPCVYLKQLRHDFPHLKYNGDPLDQKHGDDCRSSVQAINDFLGTVYDTVKFW